MRIKAISTTESLRGLELVEPVTFGSQGGIKLRELIEILCKKQMEP